MVGPHQRTQPLRQLIKAALHLFLYNLIHFAFSVYHRFRVAYNNLIDRVFAVLYYHHRTPEYIQKDVHRLKKLPKHLSVILELDDDRHDNASLESLIHDVCEVAAWSACAGVPLLSIYEPSDISMDLVDAELTESVMGEPDLLMLFADSVHLKGYPPWQLRLTEIL
ncbi:unnamed protein product [Aureobasidium pullulans]|nr:unnamed protein product [Aureobasidium pullulans]